MYRTLQQVWEDLTRAERVKVTSEQVERLRVEARELLDQAETPVAA